MRGRKRKRELILELREAHPEWSYRQIADSAGSTRVSVISVIRDAKDPEARREIARRCARKMRANAEGADRVRLARTKWRAENPEKDNAATRRWRANNRKRWNDYFKRRNSTPEGRIALAVRNATRRIVIAGGVKPAGSLALLGAPPCQVRQYVEALFQPGMSWDNHGEWHLDHVRPIASFDLADPEQVRACAHYTNLQPLWAFDNLSKGARR
jgi:hypothetical protein